MSELKTFYAHESDNQIMIKKDKSEVTVWTDDLSYVNEELEYLLSLEEQLVHNSELYRQLLTVRRENTLRLAMLHRYESTLGKAIECDTTECDAYYLNHHEKNRNGYLKHLKNYRSIKTNVLSKILTKVKMV